MPKAPPFIRALRPKQWAKNVLLALAPLAAGVLLHPDVLLEVVLGIVAFSLTSSGGYIVNDLLDIESDRLHPKKRLRPIPSGEFPVPIAWPTAIALLIIPAGVSALLGFYLFALVLMAYVII